MYAGGTDKAAAAKASTLRELRENHRSRRIKGAKSEDRRRMDDPRERIGMQFSLTGRIVSKKPDDVGGADGGWSTTKRSIDWETANKRWKTAIKMERLL